MSSIIGGIPPSLRTPLTALLVGFPVLWWIRNVILGRSRNAQGLPFAPGPKPLPLVGNIRDIVFERECETYMEWSKTYGDIIGLNVIGQPLVYVNTAEAAHEIFEKRSSIYSDRVITPMMEMMGLADWPLVILEYGSTWRKHRKIFHGRFHPGAASAFWPLHAKATSELLLNLLKDPADYVEHLRYLGGSVLVEMTYGFAVKNRDDPFLKLADDGINAFAEISKPGAFYVDVIPILRYLPEWVPFTSFKKQAREWRKTFDGLREEPWDVVKDMIKNGRAVTSFATTMIEESQGDSSVTEYDYQGAAATTYGAGTDTMLTTLESFILAMVLYPEAQKEAQKELSAVVGDKRLPDFEDRESLPYVEALLKELYRWNPALPLGVPHRLMEDDIYKGSFIPKGTIVFGNAWAILHDEKIYGPDADKFRPSRYLDNPDLPDPRLGGTFGFGRRICPGRHFADALVWLALTSVLATFDIRKEVDAQGKEVSFTPEFTSGFFHRPLPFKCQITPRSPALRSLIVKTAEEYAASK